MHSMSREVTLSIFIISRYIFVLSDPSCQPKRGRTQSSLGGNVMEYQKTTKKSWKRGMAPSSRLKYAVVLVYLKWWPVICALNRNRSFRAGWWRGKSSLMLMVTWCNRGPTSCVAPGYSAENHIFRNSTECKWIWMSCVGGTWAPPLVRVWLCFPGLLVVVLWRAQVIVGLFFFFFF